ncbi:MAG: PAS domain-containing protein [Actinomycetota bacterium]
MSAGSSFPREPQDFDVYRALVEGIPAIVYLDRPDEYSTNFYTSPQAVELLGYTTEEWGASTEFWIEKIDPDDVEAVIEENRRSNAAGDRFFAEYRMRAKDDRLVWIRDEAVLVLDDDGHPLHWQGVMLDITAQKEAEEKLRWSLDVLRRTVQQRRDLARRLEHAQEEERRRIAADIHDDPIQVMSAVDLRLQTLAATGGTIGAAEVEDLHEIVQRSIDRLRSLLFELRPGALDREGLVVALRQYADHVARETGWTAEVVDELGEEPPRELRATLYRLAQEALTNARKHADASHLTVEVASVDDGVRIRVGDDGVGFDPSNMHEPRPGHIGLSTMVERAELAGGWCKITSTPGRGTLVECWLPADDEHEARSGRLA